MSYTKHDAVIVTVAPYVTRKFQVEGVPEMPDVGSFVALMPPKLRPLVVGPIPAVTNGYVTYVFGPDGSGEGWEESELADEWRQRFIDLFSFTHDDGSSPFQLVAVSWGGDQGEARIELQQPAKFDDEEEQWPTPQPVTKVVLSDDEAPWSPITMLPNDTLTFTIDPAKLNKVHKINVRCE